MCDRPAGWCVLADRAWLGRPGSRLPLCASVAGLGGAYCGAIRLQLVFEMRVIVVVEATAACQNILSKEGLSEKVLCHFMVVEFFTFSVHCNQCNHLSRRPYFIMCYESSVVHCY